MMPRRMMLPALHLDDTVGALFTVRGSPTFVVCEVSGMVSAAGHAVPPSHGLPISELGDVRAVDHSPTALLDSPCCTRAGNDPPFRRRKQSFRAAGPSAIHPADHTHRISRWLDHASISALRCRHSHLASGSRQTPTCSSTSRQPPSDVPHTRMQSGEPMFVTRWRRHPQVCQCISPQQRASVRH